MWNWTALLNEVVNLQWFTLLNTVYQNLLGGFFYLLTAMLIYVPLYVKTESVIPPSVMMIVFGGLTWAYLPPQFLPYTYLIIALGLAGVIYSFMRRA